MLGAHGELIYVGKAKSLRARLLGYFRPRSRDPKAGRILEQTRAVVWECAPSEFAALLRELELIGRWEPRFNVQNQPKRRRRTFVCVGRRPAPYVFLTARPPAGVAACFGPVIAGRKANEAVRRLNDCFRLRDCPQSQQFVFADEAELFPEPRAPGCIRHEIGACLGPCAAACTRVAYGVQVRAARVFLEGTDRSLLERFEQDMAAASAALEFERAGVLRDKWKALRWLDNQLARVREAHARFNFVYPVPGEGGRDVWYLVRHGTVAGAVPAPACAAGRSRAAAGIDAVFSPAPPWPGAEPAAEVDGLLLLSCWFRRHPEELERALPPTVALTRCTPPVTAG
jgi:excinuclease ABC subunit C